MIHDDTNDECEKQNERGVGMSAYTAVCVAVCCSVLQCVAVCCSVLQCVVSMTHYTWSVIQPNLPISIGLVSFQRNMAKET